MPPDSTYDPERNNPHNKNRLDIGSERNSKKGKYNQQGEKKTGPEADQRFALVPLFAIGYFFFLLPFYSLWSVLVATAVPIDVRALVFFQVAAILVMRGLVDNRFREPVTSAFIHPFGFSFLFLAALYAGGLRLIGASVRWKRRLYSAESCGDETLLP